MKRLHDGTPVAYFSSGVGERHMSNFCSIPQDGLFYGGYRWRTAEHAFQAFCRVDPTHHHRLALGGDLAELDALARFYPRISATAMKKKIAHWDAKKSGAPQMAGIVAKMAVSHPSAVGLLMKPKPETGMTDDELTGLFLPILEAKYEASKDYRQCLARVAHQGALPVEHARGAERESKKARPPRWTGLVGQDGVLYGRNLQGRIQGRLMLQKGLL